MRQKLQSLSHRQSMFLLTLITLGGEEDLALLAHLPPEDQKAIKPVGKELCQTPRKQMLPQLVKEIKYLITESQRSPLDQLDPEWLAEFLLGESPRLISGMLQQFSRLAAERMLAALPIHLQRHIPQTTGSIHPDLIKRMKYLLAEKLPTHVLSNPHALTMESLAALGIIDTMVLLRELGIRELAIAFRGVGRGPLTELCRRLGPEEAERLLTVIRNLPPSTPSETKAAQRTIRAISMEHNSKSEIIEEAGLSKLHQSIQDLPLPCQQVIALHLPRRLGKRILSQKIMVLDAYDLHQLKRYVLAVLQEISTTGQVDEYWRTLPIELPEAPPAPEEPALGNAGMSSDLAQLRANSG